MKFSVVPHMFSHLISECACLYAKLFLFPTLLTLDQGLEPFVICEGIVINWKLGEVCICIRLYITRHCEAGEWAVCSYVMYKEYISLDKVDLYLSINGGKSARG